MMYLSIIALVLSCVSFIVCVCACVTFTKALESNKAWHEALLSECNKVLQSTAHSVEVNVYERLKNDKL